MCGAGAVRVATGNNPLLYVRVLGVFADWLVLNGHAGRVALDDVDVTDAAETVAAWSDDPARTAEQVADALRACAADNGETTTPSQLRHLPQTAEATTGGSR